MKNLRWTQNVVLQSWTKIVSPWKRKALCRAFRQHLVFVVTAQVIHLIKKKEGGCVGNKPWDHSFCFYRYSAIFLTGLGEHCFFPRWRQITEQRSWKRWRRSVMNCKLYQQQNIAWLCSTLKKVRKFSRTDGQFKLWSKTKRSKMCYRRRKLAHSIFTFRWTQPCRPPLQFLNSGISNYLFTPPFIFGIEHSVRQYVREQLEARPLTYPYRTAGPNYQRHFWAFEYRSPTVGEINYENSCTACCTGHSFHAHNLRCTVPVAHATHSSMVGQVKSRTA